jgi:hypothetical protein
MINISQTGNTSEISAITWVRGEGKNGAGAAEMLEIRPSEVKTSD